MVFGNEVPPRCHSPWVPGQIFMLLSPFPTFSSQPNQDEPPQRKLTSRPPTQGHSACSKSSESRKKLLQTSNTHCHQLPSMSHTTLNRAWNSPRAIYLFPSTQARVSLLLPFVLRGLNHFRCYIVRFASFSLHESLFVCRIS